MRNAGPEWGTLEDAIASVGSDLRPLRFKNDQFDVRGSVQVVSDGARGKTLRIGIGSFYASEGVVGPKGSKRRKVDFKKHSAGANFGILYLGSTLLHASQRAVDRDPDIRRIRIQGLNVMNRILARTLRRLGFKADRQIFSWGTLWAFSLANLPGALMEALATNPHLSSLGHNAITVEAFFLMIFVKDRLSASRSRSWRLELQIDPERDESEMSPTRAVTRETSGSDDGGRPSGGLNLGHVWGFPQLR